VTLLLSFVSSYERCVPQLDVQRNCLHVTCAGRCVQKPCRSILHCICVSELVLVRGLMKENSRIF